MAKSKDPTDPIRLAASEFPGVDRGTSCTQSSFKTGGKAFLYVGMQGGRYKAMFKLEKSRPEAEKLAKADPDLFQAGSTSWVTARFTAEKPMPTRLWKKWLKESYELSAAGPPAKKAVRKNTKKKATKKAAKKKTAKKKASKVSKKKTKKKATRKKATTRSR